MSLMMVTIGGIIMPSTTLMMMTGLIELRSSRLTMAKLWVG